MEITLQLYRTLFGNRAYVRSVSEGAVFLAASTIAIFAAVTYATVHASNYVTDFVLSRVGPFNVRFLFIYGTFTAFVITASLLAWRPNRLPFALKAVALFLLVRAVFVALTHMAPSPIDPQKPSPFFNSIFYGSDLFFSGHTGLPFLAALAFWHIPQWRMFYLALTAFFGSVVLLGHYHYSIDVLAALFITHGVFQASCWLFGRDYALFRSSEAAQRPKRELRQRFGKWIEAHSRKRPTLVSVSGRVLAPEPFAPDAVGEVSVPTGQSQTESRST
jgi:PAP2 superfamily C-terminal